jgi:hypothetical protein
MGPLVNTSQPTEHTKMFTDTFNNRLCGLIAAALVLAALAATVL